MKLSNPFKRFLPTSAMSTPPVSKGDMDIIMKIVQEFKDRSRKDIRTWVDAKNAIDSTELPRWNQYHDLLDYLKPDGHFGSQRGLRVASVRCTPCYIRNKKTKEKDEEKTGLIKQEWFFNMLADLMDATFYKVTLLQFPNYKAGDMKYSMVPRRNIVPEKRAFLKEVNGDVGYLIDDPAWADTFVYTVHQSDYGIVDDIVKDLIWKKNSRESWAEFSEKFGIPLVSATTTTRDKTEIARINAMLKNLGEAATAVLPKGSEITIHDSAAKGDPYKVYLENINLSNAEISKRVLGGTMLSDKGASHSQGETHERSFLMISQEDKINLEFIINAQVLPKLKGYSDQDEFVFDDTEQLSLTDQWKIVNDMITAGAQIDPKWIADRFNVPVTAFVKPATTPPAANFNQPPSTRAIALGGTGIIWPNYKGTCTHQHGPAAEAWDDIPELKRLGDQMMEHIYNGTYEGKEQWQRAVLSGELMTKGLHKGWGKRMMQIDYNATDHRALAAMEYNLFHFSAVKEQAGVLALNQMLVNKDKLEIRSFEDFRNRALPMLKDMDVNHLRTEYNLAVATGQNASRYQQFKSEMDTVTHFVQYQTVGDENVRSSHQVLDGRIFNMRDTEAMSLWPPNGWNCRCEMIQYLGDVKDKVTTGTEGNKLLGLSGDQKKMFGINRGDTGVVFTANQQYMQDKGIASKIDAMTYEKYGLQKFDELKANYKPIKIDKTITTENVKELFKKENDSDFMGFKDYLGRSLTLKEKVFTNHIASKEKYAKQNRAQLFPHIKDLLSDPDEVYFLQYRNGAFQSNYVKFYKDLALVVTAGLGKTNIEISSWFAMNKDEFVRKGLLIHKKK